MDLSALCQYEAIVDSFPHQVTIAAHLPLLAVHPILAIDSGYPSHLI
jgi:hypothetical protein